MILNLGIWLRHDQPETFRRTSTRLRGIRHSLLNPDLAEGIRRIKGGKRLGNFLTADESRKLLAVPASDSLRDKRDYAILSLLLGCGLRRAELTGLTLGHLQQRDEHWVIVNLYGKGGPIRAVPVSFLGKACLARRRPWLYLYWAL
jgi:site-specific recombinase XerC